MTDSSKALRKKMIDFAERYFDDMRLAQGSVVEKFFWVTLDKEENDDWVIEHKKEIENGEIDGWKIENGKLCHYELPDEVSRGLDVDNFCYVVDELDEGVCAQVNNEEHTVTVAPEYIEDDETLLHELIHVFEWFYCQENTPYKNQRGRMVSPCVPTFIREALFVSLYNSVKERMKEKFPEDDLDSRILNHAHYVTGEEITLLGGYHDILFFLKSLDLDLRCGLSLGTICAYNRDNHGKDNSDLT